MQLKWGIVYNILLGNVRKSVDISDSSNDRNKKNTN